MLRKCWCLFLLTRQAERIVLYSYFDIIVTAELWPQPPVPVCREQKRHTASPSYSFERMV